MQLLKGIHIENIVFVETETAREKKFLEQNGKTREAWEYRSRKAMSRNDIDLDEHYTENASLFPEFSKMICITIGQVVDGKAILKTFKNMEEKELMKQFNLYISNITKKNPKTVLSGHSIIEFDIPFIFKRSLANGIMPAEILDTSAKKPWELSVIDTNVIWKSTSKYWTSLVALCHAMGIDSPVDNLTGNEVSKVFHDEGQKGLDKISNYCESKVFAGINIIQKFKFEEPFKDYEVLVPEKPKKETVMERIARTGFINKKDAKHIVEIAKESDYEEKESQIKILKSALLINDGELSQELELEILQA